MVAILDVRAEAAKPTNFRNERELEVVVLFTTERSTLLALRSAAGLAGGLSARIRLLVPQVVPYALPLDEPAVNPCFLSHRLCALARKAGVECHIDIRLTRERWNAIDQALPAQSLVMIGRRPRWWQVSEKKMRDRLLRDGHRLVYAEGENSYQLRCLPQDPSHVDRLERGCAAVSANARAKNQQPSRYQRDWGIAPHA